MPRLADHSLTAFLRTSFQILRHEQARAFGEMVGALGRGRLYLQVDGETVVLRFGQGTPQVWSASRQDRRPPLVMTSRRAIVQLADGELTTLEAVRRGDLEVLSSPEDLLRLDRSLGYYLRGAVRCPSFPALLEEFRASVKRSSS